MNDEGVQQALTTDHDFEQAGFERLAQSMSLDPNEL
jgi:predicted nucleic acid-binding protein